MSIVRLTTFNILHESLRNFAPRWTERRALVAETLRALEPDVACLQEVSPGQLAHLREDLPEFRLLAGEISGPTQVPSWAGFTAPVLRVIVGGFFVHGEHCPILIREGSIVAAQQGTWRLESSAEPRRGALTPHVVSWARLVDRNGRGLCDVYNTHLGLVPPTALRAARDLVLRLDESRGVLPQILTGDFNSTPGGRVLRALLEGGFQDAWEVATHRVGTGQTFHWGYGLPGPRLDYFLLRSAVPVMTMSTSPVRGLRAYPSDHAALTADLDL